LTSVRAAVGGPAYEVVYANGDRCCYVSTVFEAREVGGLLAADLEEEVEVRWMELIELATADITSYARALLSDLGILPG
ncbi:MAG: NUDIX hydrolase, partial [Candidatus Dormibacteria bacterium]